MKLIHFNFILVFLGGIFLASCSDVKFSDSPSSLGKLGDDLLVRDISDQRTTLPPVTSDEEIDDVITSENQQDSQDDGSYNQSKYADECRRLLLFQFLHQVSLAPDAEIKHFRGLLSAKGTSVSSISDFAGFLSLQAESIGQIDGVRGLTHIINIDQQDTPISSTSNVRGIFLVCNMSLKSVKDFAGILAVVNGDVGTIENSRGIIRVKNGSIGSINNHLGSVFIQNGTLGEVTNHSGGVIRVN